MMYKVIDIQEADYGCEECPTGEELKSRLVLEDETGNRIYREEIDRELIEKKIDTGNLVTINENNDVIKAD